MMKLKGDLFGLLLIMLIGGSAMRSNAAEEAFKVISRTDAAPRKVVVGTSMARFAGSFDERVTTALAVIDEMAKEGEKLGTGKKLDLMVLPEYAIMSGVGK